jgi:hypothetical protein
MKRKHSLPFSQQPAVHTLPSHFFKIYFNIIPYKHLGLPSGLFPSGYPTKALYALLFSLYVPHAQSI